MANAFRENGVEFEQVNYFSEPLTENDLRRLLAKAGLEPFEVLRTREKLSKELNLSKATSRDELFKIIAENPSLLERPIVETEDGAVLARPVEKALELVGKNNSDE